jgi:patatin-like phospholipase/acyl hydrolase
MGSTFKILAIDGGGIRGVIPGMFMAEIERRTGQPISQLFDLIAGTSTGGVLALGMTVPGEDGHPRYTANDGIGFYEDEGPAIFERSLWRTLATVGNLSDERYPSEPVEAALEKYFGDSMLSEALTDVLITSYDIERRIPWFFRSFRARSLPSYDFPMKWVARATSAAPTYFETAKLDAEDGSNYYTLIDGGVFANNPTMCAYVDAMRHYPGHDDHLVVSLGTGGYTKSIPYAGAKDWGLIGWVRPIIDILMHGVNETVHYQAQSLLSLAEDGRERYYRFQVQLDDHNDAMDNASAENLRALRLAAEAQIRQHDRTIDRLCAQLTGN